MSFLSEFRDFAMRGNVVDLAVGVIIGGAFGKIIGAMVDKVMMPVIGLLIGGIDFSKQAIVLKSAEMVDGKEVPAVLLGYGEFINALIQFLIIAACLFLVVKVMNRLKKAEAPAAPAEPPAQEVLLREIRDAIRAKS